MPDKNQSLLFMLVFMLVFVIIAIAFLKTLSTEIKDVTETISNANESTNIQSARYATGVLENCSSWCFYDTNFTFTSTAESVDEVRTANDTLTLNTDYSVATYSNGTITGIYFLNTSTILNNTDELANITYVDYTYEPIDYLEDSSSRTLVNLIIVFFAIALILGALHYSGILNIGKLIGR